MLLTNQQNKPTFLSRHVVMFASILLGTAVTLTACSDHEHEEVHAEDVLDEAAEMAKKNAPEYVPLTEEELAAGAPAAAATDDASAEDGSTAEENESADAETTEADSADATAEEAGDASDTEAAAS